MKLDKLAGFPEQNRWSLLGQSRFFLEELTRHKNLSLTKNQHCGNTRSLTKEELVEQIVQFDLAQYIDATKIEIDEISITSFGEIWIRARINNMPRLYKIKTSHDIKDQANYYAGWIWDCLIEEAGKALCTFSTEEG